jgi:hypothetical protein
VFLIATPGVMLLINESSALPRGLSAAALASIAIVGLTIYDLVGRDVYGTFMRLSIVTVCMVIEFAALAALRFRRAV